VGQRRLASVFVFAVSALMTLTAIGRSEESEAAAVPPRWGTTDRIFSHVGFSEFVPILANSSLRYYDIVTNMHGVYSAVADEPFVAVAHVPSGALLNYLELDYCDNNTSPGVDVYLDLKSCNYLGGDCTTLAGLTSKDQATGCHFANMDLSSLAYTMDNNARQLIVLGTTSGGDSSTMVMGSYIGYKLQISQAPVTPTFGDVPATHPYFRAIEALAKSGITGGCGNGNYCPDKSVTRGEMAVFLARALGLHFPN